MSFQNNTKLEEKICDFFGSKYAILTDSCTHAIELALRHKKTTKAVSPFHTYISIPFTFEKLGIDWEFIDLEWRDYYYVTDDIIDAAVLWRKDSYIPRTLMCLSFQYKKHLSLG